ncbi:DUF6443 domain-containing protein [Parapedobacter deserti]|uniref:DUF6443 domain-containing protein n=1 Tax=Parapedobacter deserti TaxID=1912957 RepID=A0ABV7JGV9_9SPHI
MGKYITIARFFVLGLALSTGGWFVTFAQSANPAYGIYGGEATLTGTQSVRLLPGFHVAAGNDVHIYITEGTPLSNTVSTDRNFIAKTTYLKPFLTTPEPLLSTSAMRDVEYFDQLGRTIQQVAVRATPGNTYKDVVVPVDYDAFGRQHREYLPYATSTGAGGAFKAVALSAQANYYVDAGTVPAGQSVNTYAYSEKVFDNSPLERVVQQGFPGATWSPSSSRGAFSGRTVVANYNRNNTTAFSQFGTTRRAVRYRISYNGSGQPLLVHDGIYAEGQLTVKITYSENWVYTTPEEGRLGSVEEYSDKSGQVVLRRTFNKKGNTFEILSTYYVHDDFGNLVYVLPPGVDAATNPDRESLPGSSALATWLNNFAYQYRYDGRNRVVERKLPGNGWEYIVYNKLDLVVATQDSLQRVVKEWLVTKYDTHARVVLTGIWNNGNTVISRQSLQTVVNNQTSPNLWEIRTGNAHTNRAWPTGSITTTLTQHYYDNYNISGLPSTYAPTTFSKMVRGKVTATRTKVLGAGAGTDNMLWEVFHYDDKGRVVRTYKQHYKDGGTVSVHNYDLVDNAYNFTGGITQSVRKHYAADANGTSASLGVTLKSEYDYDHRNRMVSMWKTVNSGTRTMVSNQTYNEVGQLWKKGLHSTNGSTFGQEVIYSYNERGWLRSMESGLFKQYLKYTDSAANRQYNGNIAHQVFMRRGGSGTAPGWVADTYSYHYDAMNRLLQGTMVGKGRETLVYDKMGNIVSLQRTNGSGGLVDRMRYNYTDYGNRLKSVFDTVSTTTTGDPFQLPGTTNFTYDGNGNMKTRLNTNTAVTHSVNNITATAYNHLNLPQNVTAISGNVSYVYDASGRKLRSVNGINGQTRDYIDGIEYYNGTMELIHTEEGRIMRSGGTYTYNYFLKDHLGNNRVGFSQGTNVTAPNFLADYYPFGLQYPQSLANSGSPKNNYLYNGKELQDGIGQYDYGARFYDPVIGRWGVIDEKAEKYSFLTPYNYAANNPIKFIDPDGKDIIIFYHVQNWSGKWRQESFRFTGTNASDAPQHYFVNNVIRAYEYNVGNGGGKNLLEAATNSEIEVELRFGIDDTHRGGRITWNPFTAHEYGDITLSPATVLEHEAAHAVAYFTEYDSYKSRTEQTDKQYTNREERRVILGPERETAIKNKEMKRGQERKSHDAGRSIRVNDPTSTKEAKPFPWSMFDDRFPTFSPNTSNRPFYEW